VILVVVEKLLVEDSHLTILPVCPLKVNVPEFTPEHTVAFALIDPPTVAGLTVSVTSEEFTPAQTPDFNTALYLVVVVILE
jgi:hypothetical protein